MHLRGKDKLNVLNSQANQFQEAGNQHLSLVRSNDVEVYNYWWTNFQEAIRHFQLPFDEMHFAQIYLEVFGITDWEARM